MDEKELMKLWQEDIKSQHQIPFPYNVYKDDGSGVRIVYHTGGTGRTQVELDDDEDADLDNGWDTEYYDEEDDD